MSKLRGKPAETTNQRLKLLLIGPAGVGKTKAIIQIPKSYLIDTEKGMVHYDKFINEQKSHVWASNSLPEIVNEVRTLATEKHDFTTLGIDTFTTAYDAEVDDMEVKLGNAFGRHVVAANKTAKRLYNLITKLDMNVIMTTHQKNEYGGEGENRTVIGQTFDGWKKLDYLFDLVLYLERNPRNKKQRLATVRKTRLEAFPDGEQFVWSYDNILARFPAEMFHKEVEKAKLATATQIKKLKDLMFNLSEEETKNLKIDKVIKNADEIQDLDVERIIKGIALIEQYNELKSGKVTAPLTDAEEKAISDMAKGEQETVETDKPKQDLPRSAERPGASRHRSPGHNHEKEEVESKPETTPEQQAAIDQIATNKEDMAESDRIKGDSQEGDYGDPLNPDDELPFSQK